MRSQLLSLGRILTACVARVGFWLAVVLPLAYVPLLIGGLTGDERLTLFGLLTAHGAALYLGRDVESDSSPRGSESESTRLSTDVTFELLANRRRRAVLRSLDRRGRTAELGDVVEDVAAAENGVGRDALTVRQRKRAYAALYQHHLPKLDDAGVVEFDRERGRVDLVDASALFAYMNARPDSTWTPDGPRAVSLAQYGLVVCVGLVLVGREVGVSGLARLPYRWLTALSTVTILFIVSADAYRLWTESRREV